MPEYWIKLKSASQAAKFMADGEPERTTEPGPLPDIGEDWFVFKRGDKIAGKFKVAEVEGWWAV